MLEKLKNTSLIHLIEKKEQYENNFRIYVSSSKINGEGFFSKFKDVSFICPSSNVPEEEIIKEIEEIGNFRQNILKPMQKSTNENFTLIPQHLQSESKTSLGNYILWMDLDILILKPLNEEDLNVPEGKILVSIIKIEKKCSQRQLKEKIIKNDGFQEYFSDIYLMIKPFIPKKYKVENIDYLLNTWFLYGNRENEFWDEWMNLTITLLEIIQKHFKIYVLYNLESIAEELACSILYEKDKEKFEKLNTDKFPFIDFDEKLSEMDPSILHYEEFDLIKYHKNEFLEALKESNMSEISKKKCLESLGDENDFRR